jgi:two-component system chemotaxis response regulator CheB
MVRKKSSDGSGNDGIGNKSEVGAVVVGASAGGFAALANLLPFFEKEFPLPIIIAQHLYPESTNFMAQSLNINCAIDVKEADEKEKLQAGTAYIAPANYHLLIECDRTLSLTIDSKVNFSRPSIDVLFESAVDVYGSALIGVLLTGANSDGAQGLRLIKEAGGKTIVQDPATAEVETMPMAAIKLFKVDYILNLELIYTTVNEILTAK